jgi:hypothetical protein
MMNYSISAKYAQLWNKYRPAILNLMVAAAQGPQQYSLSDHEFRRLNPKEKFPFTLQVFEGGAVNNIKNSAVAKDLLLVLKQSKTAMELTQSSMYEFTFDRKFVLHISKPMPAEAVAETPAAEPESAEEAIEQPADETVDQVAG